MGDRPALLTFPDEPPTASGAGAIVPDMQQDPPVNTVAEFIDWLNGGREDADRNAEELLRQPPDQWDAWLAGHSAALTYHLVDELSDRASTLLTDDAGGALAIMELVVRQMDGVRVPVGCEPFLPALKANACRDLGNIHGQTGALHDALAAYERSMALLEGNPLWRVEYELARREAALTWHHLGERAQTLRIIREGIAVFEATSMTGEVLRSRIYEGWLEFEEQRPRQAAEVFTAALELAERRGEGALIARLHSNLGLCAQELGQTERAIEHLALALKVFVQQRMTAERPPAIRALARVVEGSGRIHQAILAMKRAAEDLSTDGLAMDAALLWLDLLDLLLVAGQADQLAPIASELVRTFAGADLEAETLEALEDLQRAAAAGQLHGELVGAARAELDGIR
jgi:tetratricopeptide (TPR) repeat protein